MGGAAWPISISTYGATERTRRFGDEIELLVGRVGAVDVCRIGPHQSEFVQVLHVSDVDAGQAHPDVDADSNAEIAREHPVVLRDLDVVLPGARAASASVMSPSSEEKSVSAMRRMSSG